jgi:DNA-directed RNA polymerase subunit K/omega
MPGSKKSSAIKPEHGTGKSGGAVPKKKGPKPEAPKKVPRVKVIKGVLATAGQPKPGPSKKRAPVELITGLIGPDHLTRFERARIMGARALQLSFGAPPLIEVSSELADAMSISRAELESKAIPISIRRTLPSGEFQNIPVADLM